MSYAFTEQGIYMLATVLRVTLAEQQSIYIHCGATSKDAGKKVCAINKIMDVDIVKDVVERLLEQLYIEV